jgi:hypothetical protein
MADFNLLGDVSVEGPAFSWLIKILASVLMLALVFWGSTVAYQVFYADFSWTALCVIGVSLCLCCIAHYWIWVSTTSIRHGVIEQTWIFKKSVLIKDISQAKFIYIPYLSWLIAPRLVVRSGMGLYVFHAASPEVLQAFAKLSLRPTHFSNDPNAL